MRRSSKLIRAAGVPLFLCLVLLTLAFWLTSCGETDRPVEDTLYVTDGSGLAVRAFATEDAGYILVLPSGWDASSLTVTDGSDQYDLILDGKTVPAEGLAFSAVIDRKIPLTITSAGGKTVVSSTLTVYQSAMPTLAVTTVSGSMDAINADKSYRESGRLLVADEEGSVQYNGALSSIHGRGNSTWNLRKKPYTIKLPHKVSILGLEGKKFSLLANFMDRSELRNWVSLKTVLDSGFPYAVDCAYASVWLNGEFNGVYLVTEKIGLDKNSIPVKEMKEPALTGKEKPYVIGKDGQPGSAKGLAIHSPEGADVSGGYLLELFMPERYGDLTGGFISKRGQCISIKSPENPTIEQVEYIRAYYQHIEDALSAPDGIDPATGKHYTEYIDVDSFAAMYMFEELLFDIDAGRFSTFLYKDSDTVDGKLYAGPLWDFDLTIGNENKLPPYGLPDWTVSSTYNPGENELMYELRETPSFMEAVKAAYADGAADRLKERANGETFTALADQLRGDAALDYLRWHLSGNYDESIKDMQDFIEGHTALLDSLWIREETYCLVIADTALTGNRWVDTYYVYVPVGGSLTLPKDPAESGRFLGWYITGTDTPFDPLAPITEDLRLTARHRVDLKEVVMRFARAVYGRLKPYLIFLVPAGCAVVGGGVILCVRIVKRKKKRGGSK